MNILKNLKRDALLLALVFAVGCAGTTAMEPLAWYEKDEITIGVTDSGLGGISVAADLENRLREVRAFKKVRIVFFNALFSDQGGYNSLTSRDEKIGYFDDALTSLARKYDPDLILVACNTLSVLIPETSFADSGDLPVYSIIDPGVELIEEFLADNPNGQVLLFGTRTTVEEDSHREALAQAGYDATRVITQKCPELAGTIERGFDSEDTELLIAAFVDEAVERLDTPTGPVAASLNCSHFPYAGPLWPAALEFYDLGPVPVLNPNVEMVDDVMALSTPSRFDFSTVTVEVVSRVEIPENKRRSIARAIEPVSSPTAEALLAYTLQPGLF